MPPEPIGSQLLDGPALFWLPSVVFTLHVAEELPRFPAWATRHFGVTTTAFYVYSHVPLFALVYGTSWMTATYGTEPWVMLALSVQWALFTNGVFHLLTTIAFREYSPGVVTGTLLFLPTTAFLLERAISIRLLPAGQIAWSVVIGTSVGLLVVASLWLKMNFDWRLRRGGPRTWAAMKSAESAPLQREGLARNPSEPDFHV